MSNVQLIQAHRIVGIDRIEGLRAAIEQSSNGPRIDIQSAVDSVRQGIWPNLDGVVVAPPWTYCVLYFDTAYANRISVAILCESYIIEDRKARDNFITTATTLFGHLADQVNFKSLHDWMTGFATRIHIFITRVGKACAVPLATTFRVLDSAGIARDFLAGYLNPADIDGDEWYSDYANDLAMACNYYASFAFSLCNCKNVNVVKVPVSRQVRRWSERHGQPVFEHHRLILDPATSLSAPSHDARHPENLRGESIRAMHVCRGHFARYGDQFNTGKLFGKTEGQFWIPQHVRGALNRGLITKDYLVKAVSE